VKAVVQPRDMAEAGPQLAEELLAYCRQHLSALKCPRSHRLRGRAAAPSHRQALQAPAARPLLAGPDEQDHVMAVGDTGPGASARVSRLMLFFAIVYAVEGIGQARVGIILQPLTYFLKAEGWTPLAGHRLLSAR
jgi:hypothetical protein